MRCNLTYLRRLGSGASFEVVSTHGEHVKRSPTLSTYILKSSALEELDQDCTKGKTGDEPSFDPERQGWVRMPTSIRRTYCQTRSTRPASLASLAPYPRVSRPSYDRMARPLEFEVRGDSDMYSATCSLFLFYLLSPRIKLDMKRHAVSIFRLSIHFEYMGSSIRSPRLPYVSLRPLDLPVNIRQIAMSIGCFSLLWFGRVSIIEKSRSHCTPLYCESKKLVGLGSQTLSATVMHRAQGWFLHRFALMFTKTIMNNALVQPKALTVSGNEWSWLSGFRMPNILVL